MSRQRLLAVTLFLFTLPGPLSADERIEIQRDDEQGKLTVLVDGAEAFAYQYADSVDTPYLWPVRSPSGKLLTFQHPSRKDHPHHRSIWIVDQIQLEGQESINFYHSWKNQKKPYAKHSPFQNRIRHDSFTRAEIEQGQAMIEAKLVWEIDRKIPVLDQVTRMVVKPLGPKEYLIDLAFELTASYGDVVIQSDKVHYAWPYVRMHSQFSGKQGGTITADDGRLGEKGTHDEVARWIDYSNSIDSAAEGLTLFSHPINGRHRWLVREYGAFGPRRPDKLSGTKFSLKKGESLPGRVGILVHRGNVKTGQVAERYQTYVDMTQEKKSDSLGVK